MSPFKKVESNTAFHFPQHGELIPCPLWQWSPIILEPGTVPVFPGTRVGNGFRMIQAHYIYCPLDFYCYCISSTSDLHVWGPGGWEVLPYDLEPSLIPLYSV